MNVEPHSDVFSAPLSHGSVLGARLRSWRIVLPGLWRLAVRREMHWCELHAGVAQLLAVHVPQILEVKIPIVYPEPLENSRFAGEENMMRAKIRPVEIAENESTLDQAGDATEKDLELFHKGADELPPANIGH